VAKQSDPAPAVRPGRGRMFQSIRLVPDRLSAAPTALPGRDGTWQRRAMKPWSMVARVRVEHARKILDRPRPHQFGTYTPVREDTTTRAWRASSRAASRSGATRSSTAARIRAIGVIGRGGDGVNGLDCITTQRSRWGNPVRSPGKPIPHDRPLPCRSHDAGRSGDVPGVRRGNVRNNPPGAGVARGTLLVT
jgi:hypothetical protein